MIKQQERRARVARTCASDPNLRNSLRASGGMEYSFLFDPDHNLLGCLQPKVGSTTWHQHFVSLANEKRRTQLEKRSRQDQAMMMRPRDTNIVSLAKTSISFSMVRHPFERIISAYEDKILNWNGLENVWSYVRNICTTQFG